MIKLNNCIRLKFMFANGTCRAVICIDEKRKKRRIKTVRPYAYAKTINLSSPVRRLKNFKCCLNSLAILSEIHRNFHLILTILTYQFTALLWEIFFQKSVHSSASFLDKVAKMAAFLIVPIAIRLLRFWVIPRGSLAA